MVTHGTRILEIPGLNPGADQPDWVFSCFSSVIKATAGLDFHYHDPFDHSWPYQVHLEERDPI